MPRDGKFKLIAHKAKTTMPNVLSVWLWLLDYASQQDTRGDIKDLDPEEVDVYYAFDEGTTQKILDEMECRNLIADGRVQHWERFQSNEAEKNRERQKRFREKHSAKNNVTNEENNVTNEENNVTVTLRNAQTRLDKIRQDNNIYTTATDVVVEKGGVGENKTDASASYCDGYCGGDEEQDDVDNQQDFVRFGAEGFSAIISFHNRQSSFRKSVITCKAAALAFSKSSLIMTRSNFGAKVNS